MKIFFFFIFLFNCSLLANTFDHFLWYQSFEVTHSTIFKKILFRGNQVANDTNFPTDIEDNHLTITSYNYINKFSYKYLFFSLIFNYTHSEDQFFDINNRLESRTIFNDQFTLIPEISFKWKLLSIGIGYFITFGTYTPLRPIYLYNRDSPFFKIKLDQKFGKAPLYGIISFYTSPNQFNFDDNAIYSISGGFRWDATYYVSLSFIYTRNYLVAQNIEDNIMKIQFTYRILPYLSLGTYYSQLVYTENQTPYNEASLNVNYLHDFSKNK